MKDSKVRLNYIDYAKGIGILIIIWGHLFESPAKEFTGSFKVPLFFVISGVLIGLSNSRKVDFKETVRKKWQSLMIPYIWFSLFDCLYEIARYHQAKTGVSSVYATLTMRGLYTLWFLPALFFALIGFYYFREKGTKALLGMTVLSVAVTGLVSTLLPVLENTVPTIAYKLMSFPVLSLFHALTAFVFLIFGYYLGLFMKKDTSRTMLTEKNTSERSFQPHRSKSLSLLWIGIAFLVAGIGINLLLSGVDLNMGKLGNPGLLFYPTALLLTGGGVLLLSYIPDTKPWTTLLHPLAWCGTNSLILMITHLPYSTVITKELMKIVAPVPNGYGWDFYLYTLAALIICMAVEYVVVRVINWKFKFLLGKLRMR